MKLEHIGIAVKNLEAANDLYALLLGKKHYKIETVESEQVNTSFFKTGSSKIELLEATGPKSAIARHIEKRGEGIHHIAFEVKDIYAEMERLRKEGFRLLNEESQSLVGSWVFYKNGKLDLERSWMYGIPTIIGAIFGVLVAVWVSNEQFKQVFSFMMVAMFLVILVKPKRWLRETDLTVKRNYWLIIPGFLAIGFYGGFIQMGMGIFFLAIMVLGARHSMTIT